MKCVDCKSEVSEVEFAEIQRAIDQISEIDPDLFERLVFVMDQLSSDLSENSEHKALWQGCTICGSGYRVTVLCTGCYETWRKYAAALEPLVDSRVEDVESQIILEKRDAENQSHKS